MTIKDIARESGYAVSTVSRALNDHPDVSREAKKRIAEVVAAHGFVPNNNARQLKQQQSKSIAIVVKGTYNMFFSGIVEQMQNLIGCKSYVSILHYLDEDDNEVLAGQQICRERKPLGIIFLGGNRTSFERDFGRIEIPCVLTTNQAEGLPFRNLSSVSIDDVEGARLAVDYLFEQGHTEIAVLGGNCEKSYTSAQRYEGCRKSFSARGKELSPERYEKASFNYGSGYRGMQQLMERNRGLSAVFCMSDVMAVGAARAIQDAGLRVPEDISVIGFDGIELTDFTCPRFTTIQQNQKMLAESSVELLLGCIEKGAQAQNIRVGVRLVERDSVRRLKTASLGGETKNKTEGTVYANG